MRRRSTLPSGLHVPHSPSSPSYSHDYKQVPPHVTGNIKQMSFNPLYGDTPAMTFDPLSPLSLEWLMVGSPSLYPPTCLLPCMRRSLPHERPPSWLLTLSMEQWVGLMEPHPTHSMGLHPGSWWLCPLRSTCMPL